MGVHLPDAVDKSWLGEARDVKKINLKHARAIMTINDQWTWRVDMKDYVRLREVMAVVRNAMDVYWVISSVGPIRWQNFDKDNRL